MPRTSARVLTAACLGAALAAPGGRLAAQAAPAACSGGVAGTTTLWDTVEVAYLLAHAGGRTRLAAAVVAQAPPGWWAQSAGAAPDLRDARGRPRPTTGGAVGPVWVQVAEGTDSAWFGGRPVALGGANVVLLRVDRLGGAPAVAGLARTDAPLPPFPGLCGQPATPAGADAFDAALRAALERTPAVRAFVGPRAAP